MEDLLIIFNRYNECMKVKESNISFDFIFWGDGDDKGSYGDYSYSDYSSGDSDND